MVRASVLQIPEDAYTILNPESPRISILYPVLLGQRLGFLLRTVAWL